MDTRVMELTPEVISAINEELAYVATLADQGRSDTVHYGIVGQLATLQTYARYANDDWVTNPGSDAALNTLRKCAAIAIRALLTEGCPRRGGLVTIAPVVESVDVAAEEPFESDAAVGGV